VRTIIELVAEKGFADKSFGKDFLSNHEIHEGYCTSVIITDKCIMANDNSNIEMISDSPTSARESEHSDAFSRNHAWQTLAKGKYFNNILWYHIRMQHDVRKMKFGPSVP
jgi:hypothetical protein